MSFQTLLLPLLIMSSLGLGLAFLLGLAKAKLRVEENPLIETVDLLLPQANCGACGSPGCHAFAEKLALGKAQPALCTVSPQAKLEEIALVLGVDAGKIERRVARLACQGGSHVARQRAQYHGPANCHAANLVAGGAKGCSWGCLGYGDCVRVCNFGALALDENQLPVVDEAKCTACGQCVRICPKRLFSLEEERRHLFVACKNLFWQEEAEQECLVACTGCGLCAADSPPGLVRIQDNLARIQPEAYDQENPDIIQRCPTGAILWIEAGQKQKGRSARKILRHSPLNIG